MQLPPYSLSSKGYIGNMALLLQISSRFFFPTTWFQLSRLVSSFYFETLFALKIFLFHLWCVIQQMMILSRRKLYRWTSLFFINSLHRCTPINAVFTFKLGRWTSLLLLLTTCIDVHQILQYLPPNLEGIISWCQASFAYLKCVVTIFVLNYNLI